MSRHELCAAKPLVGDRKGQKEMRLHTVWGSPRPLLVDIIFGCYNRSQGWKLDYWLWKNFKEVDRKKRRNSFLVLWLRILSSWIRISRPASLVSDEMTLPQALLVNATFKGLMLYHAVFSLLSGDSACKLDDKFKSTRTSYNSGIMTKFNWFTLVFWCSQICLV